MVRFKLLPLLGQLVSLVKSMERDIVEWQKVQRRAETMGDPGSSSPAEAPAAPATTVVPLEGQHVWADIGSGYHMQGTITDTSCLLVNIGLGFLAELTPAEACRVAAARIAELQSKAADVRRRMQAVERDLASATGALAALRRSMQGAPDEPQGSPAPAASSPPPGAAAQLGIIQTMRARQQGLARDTVRGTAVDS